MNKYPEYKESQNARIREYPASWVLKRFKRFAKICNGQDQKKVIAENGKYPILGTGGEFGRSNDYLHNKPSVLLGRKGTIDRPIYIDEPFWTVDTLYYTDIFTSTNPKFFYYLCKTINFDKYRTGSAVPSMTQEDLNEILFTSPPLNEQTAIANFLDLKTQQIDDLIARKERLIELLKEERTAVINQAVTKGLDPDVPMKDSGIEWLGEIPEHWEIIQLKFLSKIRYGLGQPPKIKEDGLPMIRATNIHRGNISEEDLLFVDPDDLPYDRNPILKEGDIVVVRSGAYTADSAIITNKYSGCVTGYDMVISSNKIDQQFLSYTLLSAYVLNNQLIPVSSRAAQPHLNAEELGSTLICVPPNKEQKSISQYLIDELEHIDGVVINGEQQISYLSEYKTSLINETVTGKIDVRE